MEDLLVALIQGIFELLSGGFDSDFFNAFFSGWSSPSGQGDYSGSPLGDSEKFFLIAMVYFAFGLATGAISLHFLHDVLFCSSGVRLAWFFVLTPGLCGFCSWMLAHLRAAFGEILQPRQHYWWAVVFGVGLSIVRLGFCHRPA